MWLELILAVILLLLIIKLKANPRRNNFWKENGIYSIDISNIAKTWELLLGTKTMMDIDLQVYKEMGNEKVCGIVEAGTPILFVKDLDLMKLILIKDFDHFVDRRTHFSSSEAKSLIKMLPSLTGTEWHGTRVSMSPAFTTGKIRRIMEFFNSCGKEISIYIKVRGRNGKPIDIKVVGGQYAVDVIASAVFGLNAGTIQDPNSPFLRNTEQIGGTSFWAVVRQSLALRFPAIFKLLKMNATNTTAFFDEIFKQSLKARESGKAPKRNDFLQLLVEARKGILKAEGDDELSQFEKEAVLKDNQEKYQYLLDDDVATAQGFLFFLAGYHGIAMTTTYAIHTLAYFPNCLRKLKEELEGKFKEDGTIDYDVVNELSYMDMFVSEILRFYPITPRIERICTKDYNKPEFGLKIEKGMLVNVPMAVMHKDPKYFQYPDEFNPENFNKENKARRSPYAYMPFGVGPRNCIGMRFALVEVKTVIAHLVNNFEIEKDATTPKFPLKTKLVGLAIQIPGKIFVKLTPRKV